MKAPKRTVADHLSFTIWIIFCIVITIMMIQIPKAAQAEESWNKQTYDLYYKDTPELRKYVRDNMMNMITGSIHTFRILHIWSIRRGEADTRDTCTVSEADKERIIAQTMKSIESNMDGGHWPTELAAHTMNHCMEQTQLYVTLIDPQSQN